MEERHIRERQRRESGVNKKKEREGNKREDILRGGR